ncbi:hypothetical protein BDV96DRAFT_587714 [Lophiotrema nucula]|uniref:Uncharacterized protein n=1 Tax=Lophiotrema nucula TaxID=690887 RepID=A0A6A5YMR4_9PLEO|nr:hypothetical protein BDV96DRAFT_587714 [Lophiotrema nucula]
MVLEALAAVSLAGTIVQFVQFSCSLLSLTASIKKSDDGLSSGHSDLQLIAGDINKFCAKFAVDNTVDPSLARIASRSQSVAKDLLSAIEKITKKYDSHEKTRGWEHFSQALKSIWNKKTINELMARVEALRDQMQLHLTSEIRDNQIESMKQMAEMRASGMRYTLQHTDRLTELSIKLDSIERALQSDGDTYLGRLTDQFTRFAGNFERIALHNRILQSLLFHTMKIRHATIPEAHMRTFDWVFASHMLPVEDVRSDIQFATWLAHGVGLYWVTGKPGSGKSTLMKYLEDHSTTQRLLETWASGRQLIRASFYFWNAGTSMQKSLRGLLQSLLYHILDACPGLADILCPERVVSLRQGHFAEMIWTLKELREAFRILKQQYFVPAAFYFHIDGLDEYDEDEGESYIEVIRILQDLAESSGVKLCLSSRPWNIFEDTFGQSNSGMLRLHELTEKDIELFAYETLIDQGACPQNRQQHVDYLHLVSEIRQRAQGVFLWVRLVIRSLRDGIINNDQLALLQERLHRIPSDLEPFFEHILNSVDSVYQERMSQTFLIAIASHEPLKITHYSFLEEDEPDFSFRLPFERLTGEEVDYRLWETQRRLNGRYKGLLEPSKPANALSRDDTVDFLHRTVRDFLLTPRIQQILLSRVDPSFDAQVAIAYALLAEAKYVKTVEDPQCLMALVEYIANVTRERDSTLEFDIIDHLDQILLERHYPWGTDYVSGARGFSGVAVHIGRLDYLEHRLATTSKEPQLRPLLRHALFQGVTKMDQQTWVSYAHCKERSPDHRILRVALIQCLLEHGADVNSKATTESIFREFSHDYLYMIFKEPEKIFVKRTMHGEADYAWNKAFGLLLKHGADQATALEIWVDFFNHWALANPAVPYQDYAFLGVFTAFLENGFRPQLKLPGGPSIWCHYLEFFPNIISSHNDRTSAHLRLLQKFMSSGANVEDIFRYEEQHNRDDGVAWIKWLLQCLQTGISGEIHMVFASMLQNGLDPNRMWNGDTLWTAILHAVVRGRFETSEEYQIQVYSWILKDFLWYGADPNNALLQDLVSSTEKEGALPPRAQEVVRIALLTERRYVASRDSYVDTSRMRAMGQRPPIHVADTGVALSSASNSILSEQNFTSEAHTSQLPEAQTLKGLGRPRETRSLMQKRGLGGHGDSEESRSKRQRF